MDSAMDLTVRSISPSSSSQVTNKSPSTFEIPCKSPGVGIVRPTPRPPWSILWYQNIWSTSLNGQSESTTDNNCKGKASGESFIKSRTILRTNERSSFSVLHNISTNCIDDANNNSNIPIAHTSLYRSPEYQLQSQLNVPNDNYTKGFPRNETRPLGAAPSLLAYEQYISASIPLHEPHQSNKEHDTAATFRSTCHSQDDSDDSENILLTSHPNGTIDSDGDCVKTSSSSCVLAKMVISQFPSVRNNHRTTAILDVACCDGPVQFKRISNPNFALTVEHSEASAPAPSFDEKTRDREPPRNDVHHQATQKQLSELSSLSSKISGSVNESRFELPEKSRNSVAEEAGGSTTNGSSTSNTVTTHKSYLCIYCNQSFKSLFCYQKHKKRHLNPVSVDITTTTANSTSYRGNSNTASGKRSCLVGGASSSRRGGGSSGGGGGGSVGTVPENAKAKTKDLNVQFFPCKKCGCKFPSYYFVHKHRKICH